MMVKSSSDCDESELRTLNKLLTAAFIEVSGAETGAIKFILLRQKQFCGSGFKAFDDVIGYRVHKLDHIAFTQQLPAEAVQTLNFPPALMRLIRFFANA